MKKTFIVKIITKINNRIIDAKVDEVEFFGITNKYGLTSIGYNYHNYIQHFLDNGYEMVVVG